MKKLIFALIATTFLFHNCSNDFEVNGEEKDTPVVYGLLDQSDETHYIRIERAFLDGNTNAFVLADNPDEFYYDNITVNLEEIGTNNVYPLTKVDVTNDFPRDTGVFAHTPNYLYATDAPLLDTRSYRLVIENAAEGTTATAETEIIKNFQLNAPLANTVIRWGNDDVTRSFVFESKNGSIYDLSVLLYVSEKNLSTGEIDNVELVWDAVKGKTVEDANISEKIKSADLYSFVAGNVTPRSGYSREVDSVGVLISLGGESLSRFINVINANNGVTGSQPLPVFTNVDGGLGILSSRNSLLETGFRLSTEAKDSLALGSRTRDLGFVEP